MKLKAKKVSGKSKKSAISITLYVVASVVALVGVALLINNIFLFKSTVNQYVAQGYTAQTVINELLTAQLLPGIFEPVAVYGGIAVVLLGVGIVNKKVSKCLILLNKVEVCNDTIGESIVEPNVANVENTEVIQQTETVEEAIKA